ncbi:MAG: nucleotidyltransferase domain-containing protein [Candidatus Pacearchaeota archaeon]
MSEKKYEESVEKALSNNYIPKSKAYIPKSKAKDLPTINPIEKDLQESLKKLKENLEVFYKKSSEKFKFIEAVGLIPQQASKKIEEEYLIPEEEAKQNLIHVLVLIPEEKFKEIQKTKIELIKIAKEIDKKIWIHLMTPVDLWNLCLDSKYEIIEAISMSFPIYDKGLLGALRVTQLHKTFVLKKFEKYVTSYVFFGSLVRGEAKSTSDIDVGIIIDDTDVKKMPRLELKEKLRAIIFQYIEEACAIAGVKNVLNVQVWLLTEFWEGVKDANPVFFTFIRDGIPLYDRGTFLPWKSLLKMGKIKPTPEALDMFMLSGDRLEENVNRRLLDIVVIDLYWGVIMPTQGILMLYGLAPPTTRETVRLFREIIVEKEKLLDKKYADIVEEIMIKYYKGYEHGKIKKVTGKELDDLFNKALDYLKKLKEIRKKIETRVQKKSIEEVYEQVFGMLEALLKIKGEKEIIKKFEEDFVKVGKMPKRFLDSLVYISKVRKEVLEEKKKKNVLKDLMTGKEINEVEQARKLANEIINYLIEYSQRFDFLSMDRKRFVIKGTKKEIFFLNNTFLVDGEKIKVVKEGKILDSSLEELNRQLEEKSNKNSINIKDLEILKKELDGFELEY